MPSIFKFLGYLIYFWSNENGEPMHVHISRGRQTSNATKVWLTHNGYAVLCHNNSKISLKDLNKLLRHISEAYEIIKEEWVYRFGYESYYC